MKVTEWLAIYAALLSTTIFAWNFLQTRPRAKTSTMFGFKEEEGVGIFVIVYNRSAHKIHISNISLLYEFQKTSFREKLKHLIRFRRLPIRIGWCHHDLELFGFSTGCPVSIEPRSSHEVFVPEEKLLDLLSDAVSTRIAACAQDKLAQNSYARPINYDLPSKRSRARA